MHDFVRQSIQLRKDHEYAFAPLEHGGGMPFDWKSPSNGTIDWDSRQMMIHYYNDGNWNEPELAVLINLTPDNIDFTLPQGRTWTRILDTQSYYDLDGQNGDPEGYFNSSDANPRQTANVSLEGNGPLGSTYGLPGFSIAIIEEYTEGN